MGHLGHDGGTGRRFVRKLDDIHRPQLLHPPGVDAPGLHPSFSGGWRRYGAPCSALSCSSCSKRGCASYRSCPASTSVRPGRSSSESCWWSSCCSGHRALWGGSSYDCGSTGPDRPRRGLRSENEGCLKALRRGKGRGTGSASPSSGNGSRASSDRTDRESRVSSIC